MYIVGANILNEEGQVVNYFVDAVKRECFTHFFKEIFDGIDGLKIFVQIENIVSDYVNNLYNDKMTKEKDEF